MATPCPSAGPRQKRSAHRAEFDTLARPPAFTGEARFPWDLSRCLLQALQARYGSADGRQRWDKHLRPAAPGLQRSTTQAAVYFDDMYVDLSLQLDAQPRGQLACL